jgi:hypothetical protein
MLQIRVRDTWRCAFRFPLLSGCPDYIFVANAVDSLDDGTQSTPCGRARETHKTLDELFWMKEEN